MHSTGLFTIYSSVSISTIVMLRVYFKRVNIYFTKIRIEKKNVSADNSKRVLINSSFNSKDCVCVMCWTIAIIVCMWVRKKLTRGSNSITDLV